MIILLSFCFYFLSFAKGEESTNILKFSAYRTNFCSIHQDVEKNLLSREYALVGKNLSVAISTEIDEANPNIEIRILKEVSRRAGFSFTPYATGMPKNENETWTDVLLYNANNFDIAVNWWDRTIERMSEGIIFPVSWYDSDSIMVVKQAPMKDTFSFFSFSRPFSPRLWVLTLLTIIGTGVLYYFLDFLQSRKKRTKLNISMEGSIFTSFYSFTGSRSVYAPKSRASRILIISMAFLYLILASAYTANLTNYYIVKSRPSISITDMNDVIRSNLLVCAPMGYASTELLKSQYSTARVKEIRADFDERNVLKAVSEEICDIGLVSMEGFQLYKKDIETNIDCDLERIGNRIFFAGAGFGISDSENLCSSLLQNVLDFHLLQMRRDGMVERIMEEHNRAQIKNQCVQNMNSEEERDFSVTILNMGGAFAFHFCFVIVALIVGLHDYYRQPREIKRLIKNEMSQRIKSSSTFSTRRASSNIISFPTADTSQHQAFNCLPQKRNSYSSNNSSQQLQQQYVDNNNSNKLCNLESCSNLTIENQSLLLKIVELMARQRIEIADDVQSRIQEELQDIKYQIEKKC